MLEDCKQCYSQIYKYTNGRHGEARVFALFLHRSILLLKFTICNGYHSSIPSYLYLKVAVQKSICVVMLGNGFHSSVEKQLVLHHCATRLASKTRATFSSNQKPIVSRLRAVSRASRQLHVFTFSFDRFVGIFCAL